MTVYNNVLGRATRLMQASPLMLHVWPLLHQVKVIQLQNVLIMVMSLKMMKVATVLILKGFDINHIVET